MLMLKLLGCGLILASSAGIGVYFSSQLRARIEELMELKKILMLLRGNIRYACTPLAEALHSISLKYSGEFREFLDYVCSQMNQMEGKTIADIWKEGVEQKLSGLALSKQDKEALIHFGSNLGYLDKDMQLSTIDLYIATLETEIEEATKTVKEKSYLYNSLGIMAGLFVTIILI